VIKDASTLERIFRVMRKRFVRAELKKKKPHKKQASQKTGRTKTRSRKNQISLRRRFSPGPLLFVQPLLLVCQRSPRGFHAHEGQPRLLVFGPLGKEGAILSIITKNIS
jgi:hypothetical protein